MKRFRSIYNTYKPDPAGEECIRGERFGDLCPFHRVEHTCAWKGIKPCREIIRDHFKGKKGIDHLEEILDDEF